MSNIWILLVPHYTGYNLTFEPDKLPAFSAIAKRIQRTGALGTYLAGLWLEDLSWFLCWRVSMSRSAPFGERDAVWHAPTWSWASIRGNIDLGGDASGTESQINVLSAFTIPKGPDPLGSVSDGYLRLSGFLQVATIDLEDFRGEESRQFTIRNSKGQRLSFRPDQNPKPPVVGTEELSRENPRNGARKPEHGDQVWCLKIFSAPQTEELTV